MARKPTAQAPKLPLIAVQALAAAEARAHYGTPQAPEPTQGRPTSLCLTKDEIAELTRAKSKRLQIEFLHRNGIRHFTTLAGFPVVTRAAVEGWKEPARMEPRQPEWRSNMEG